MIELPTMYHDLAPQEKRQVRERYIDLQDNRCWYCNTSFDEELPQWVQEKPINLGLFPNGFLDHPIHLQHDHKTGLTEGAVHAHCNAVLWQYEGR